MTAAAAGSLHAADRTLSITDFDRIRATGTMTVIVTKSYAASVRMSGDQHDLDTIETHVSAQTLVIGVAHFGWGSSAVARGPLTVYVSTPRLRAATLVGSGRMVIDQLGAPRVDLALVGAGEMNISEIAAENLTLSVSGSGRLTAAGKAAQAQLSAQGSATLEAESLVVQDAKISAFGAATIGATASRSADITAAGSGTVNVSGHPACVVHNAGAGEVICG